MVKSEIIKVQTGEEVIELTGEAKQTFLADRQATADAKTILEAEYQAKRDARESAIKKLADIAGLTKDELASIL